jgi:ABC-2 type transport system permease protein
MHNLGTVVRFEIARTLKKKSFWIAALAVPTIIAAVGAIIFFSNKTTDTESQNLANEHYSFAVTYTDGQEDKGFLKLIAPGLFLVLFYFMIATFGNQILTSVTEEKENRVIEMILATIKPTTLLVGKLLSLIVLAFIQMFVILVPVVVGYLTFKSQLSLPSLDLSSLPLDPVAISLGAAIFIVSYLMYTGILMTLGAAMPTAKEAGGFFGAIMALTFGPLYAAPLFISAPHSLLVQILSYFPLTAPIPLLLRNAVGNLELIPALISLGLLIITTILAISVGVRIFRFGALEYSRKLSVKEVLRRKS